MTCAKNVSVHVRHVCSQSWRCRHNIRIIIIRLHREQRNFSGALFRRRDLFGQNITSSGRMVERHKYQMIQTQQPHGQEQDQQQQHETMRKQHETTIHRRDMQEG